LSTSCIGGEHAHPSVLLLNPEPVYNKNPVKAAEQLLGFKLPGVSADAAEDYLVDRSVMENDEVLVTNYAQCMNANPHLRNNVPENGGAEEKKDYSAYGLSADLEQSLKVRNHKGDLVHWEESLPSPPPSPALDAQRSNASLLANLGELVLSGGHKSQAFLRSCKTLPEEELWELYPFGLACDIEEELAWEGDLDVVQAVGVHCQKLQDISYPNREELAQVRFDRVIDARIAAEAKDRRLRDPEDVCIATTIEERVREQTETPFRIIGIQEWDLAKSRWSHPPACDPKLSPETRNTWSHIIDPTQPRLKTIPAVPPECRREPEVPPPTLTIAGMSYPLDTLYDTKEELLYLQGDLSSVSMFEKVVGMCHPMAMRQTLSGSERDMPVVPVLHQPLVRRMVSDIFSHTNPQRKILAEQWGYSGTTSVLEQLGFKSAMIGHVFPALALMLTRHRGLMTSARCILMGPDGKSKPNSGYAFVLRTFLSQIFPSDSPNVHVLSHFLERPDILANTLMYVSQKQMIAEAPIISDNTPPLSALPFRNTVYSRVSTLPGTGDRTVSGASMSVKTPSPLVSALLSGTTSTSL
jgi:hypothetical protein